MLTCCEHVVILTLEGFSILAYTTFAVGFVARPVGGVIFGHYGDRIGRKAMLVTMPYRKDIDEEEPEERQLVAEQQG